MEKPKPNPTKDPKDPKAAARPAGPAGPAIPVKVAPMCRPIDWLAMAITFAVIWIVYLFTLAPEQTLEDSGELCTGAFYAGIPHPPGYPFWSVYAWFWTAILPFGNVAWRVEVGESFAAAMGCGMVALMVSRGSSMLIEGIEAIKNLPRQWENAISLISGFVAGTLLGLDVFMWSESVVINRISLFGVPWLIAVLACLMRWMYAPQQRRYLYLAMFLYGLCATIHQSLLLSAMGVEVAIALASPRLGRDVLLGNAIIFIVGLILLAAGNVPALNNMTWIERFLFYVVGASSMIVGGWLALHTKQIGSEWKSVVLMGVVWVLGVSVYFYEPISGMTDPPMQWGYPRTVEGFFHALSRGQYESSTGSNYFQNPSRFFFQLGYIVRGLADSFSWVYMFIGLLPYVFLMKMHRRERSWVIGLTSIYFCLSVLLANLLCVSPDRSSSDLDKVFFTASHGLFALMIGYGLALLAAYIATHYQTFRRWGLLGGGVALLLALYSLVDQTGTLYFGPGGGFPAEHTFLLGIIIACGLAFMSFVYVQVLRWVKSYNEPVLENIYIWGLPGGLILAALIVRVAFPEFAREFVASILNFIHDFISAPGEIIHTQLPHYIGLAFAKYQYGLPVYATLILLAIPICYLGALMVYRQRGPLLILLCLFSVMPLWSGLSHWYKSEQHNHWFGFWFGHDMFTPPFTDPKTGLLSYDNGLRATLLNNPTNATLIYPEMDRNTILFGGTDPGRFCPTYSIFCDSFIPHSCQPKQDQKFDRRDCYLITQNALADGTYLDYLRAQYNRSKQIDPPFFSELSKYVFSLFLGPENSDSGLTGAINSMLYTVLDRPFTAWGAYVEKYRRARGVYPPSEIYIPSPDDSQKCFQDYTEDVARRQQLGQLQPGEDVHIDNGRVQVAGQVAVMNINGLLCKVIFDNNPTNSFYVEESFPLNWMYPYETPFGIIMKINRNPLPELSDDVFKLDHEFWTKYTTRLCGNWITYDTSVQQIADFVDRTYIHNNYTGYSGDRAFVRDDDAQKAFSKLRSSQAGMYFWRMSAQCPAEYRQKTAASQAALIKETEFAFKQAFAFCPYSPEAVYRYCNFLLQMAQTEEMTGHPDKAIRYFDDAILVGETCQKLDPYNQQIIDLISNVKTYKSQVTEHAQALTQAASQMAAMETMARTNPANVQNMIMLGGNYLQMQQTNRAVEMLDTALARPEIKYDEATAVAQYYAQMGDFARLETAIKKLVSLAPDQPEPRYDLAALQAIIGDQTESLQNLKIALDMSAQRLAKNPAARDLQAAARTDNRLDRIRALPEFQKLVPPK
jgi:tetratricopeptide (TPR) repeat protein